MKQIVINATAARTSGALTIIKDFMNYIYQQSEPELFYYLLTTTEGFFHNSNNVQVYELHQQNWRNRIIWDKYGFQEWCESKNIVPNVVVSFQNTCPRLTNKLSDVKLLVYYHQPLPLVKYPWKLYRSDECRLFLYAHFYAFFVNRWNKNAEYVVQLTSIKELFCKRFPNIKNEKVHVIRPNLPKIDIDSVPVKQIYDDRTVFIYPATPLRYKNHIVILKALDYLKKVNPELEERIKVVFTVPKNSFVAQYILKMGLNSMVECIESIPYEELLSYYKRSNTLLFPSKIESFGLPLIEATMFGLQIIASDLPFSKEVLENYDYVKFLNPDDYRSWAYTIRDFYNNPRKKENITVKNENAWKQFEQIICSL